MDTYIKEMKENNLNEMKKSLVNRENPILKNFFIKRTK